MENNCKKNEGKIKKGGYNGGRGYSGHHITWENKKVFLRSRGEFIYATVLDREKIKYGVELQVYQIGEKRYKPDFFILDEKENFLKIVEIKDNKKEALDYHKKYYNFFKTLDINYEVVYKFSKLITQYNLQNTIDLWIEKSIKENPKLDMRGENNPRFGISASEDTKLLIGNKTKERNKDVAYHTRWRNSIKLANQRPEVKKRYSEAAIKRCARQKEARGLKDPIIERHCVICNDIFKIRQSSSRLTCTSNEGKCTRILHRDNMKLSKGKKHGLASYPKKLIKAGQHIIENLGCKIIRKSTWEQIVQQAKKDQLIPKGLGISLKTINKYFDSFEKFYEEII